ncbi:MAG: acetylornithine aminotransferase, partial [Bdellovibrionota bacterium]
MSKLIGRTLAESARIQTLISELVAEVGRVEEGITTARPPNDAFADSSKKLIEDTNKVRGRPLFYPFLGTG